MTAAGQSGPRGGPFAGIEAALAAGRAALSEVEAKHLLAAKGIAVPEGMVATSVEEAVATAERLGYPVVMKGVSTTILHKTEAGLVRLDIQDREDARRVFAALSQAGGDVLSGVLVERQLPREREFMAGMVRDPQFGAVIMFGLGGILAEALDDVAFAIAPLSRADALRTVDALRARAVVGSYRGLPAVDREALAELLCTIGRMALDHPEIAEMDLNPLLVDQGRPVAADCLIRLRPPTAAVSARLSVNLLALDALYAPRSVGIVGASNDPSKWGGTILTNLIAGGYSGRLYPVARSAETVMGMKAYGTVSELPEAPDVVVVAVPGSAALSVVEECGARGVRAVVMVTAGFSETGAEGHERERELAEAASRHGMALIGPNCMGVVSAASRFFGVGAVHLHPKPGPAAFVSQSGNIGVQLMVSAEQRGGGIGSFVGVGNEALFHTADLLDYLRDDPQVGVVAAYVEGYDDGRRLLESARALAAKKPLVVLRAAVSDYGRRAAASHTGALAGSQKVFEGAARQAGMLLTFDPDEFLDTALAFSYLPLPRGERVGIVTMGGGWGVLSADEVARTGLRLAEFDPDLLCRLDGLLPPYWSRGNPVDLVATLVEGAAERVVEEIIASDTVDLLLVSGVVSVLGLAEAILVEAQRLDAEGAIELQGDQFPDPGLLSQRREQFIRHLISLMERYEKPIYSVAAVPVAQGVFPDWGRYGVVVISSPLRAVRVAAKMVEYAQRRMIDQG